MFEIVTNNRFFFIVLDFCLHECGFKSCLSGARIIQPVRLDPHVSWFSRMDNVVTGHVNEGMWFNSTSPAASPKHSVPKGQGGSLGLHLQRYECVVGEDQSYRMTHIQGHPVSDNF